MKLIDKEKVVAEIEKLKGKISDSSSCCNGWKHALRMLELSLDTLEVKEVDLEKEFDSYCEKLFVRDVRESLYDCARHFFELGLKAKGE